MQNLYNLGARKFGIFGIPPIGCCPAIRAVTPGGACNETLNSYAQIFYNATFNLLQHFSSANPEMNFSLGNSFLMTKGVIDNAAASGKYYSYRLTLISFQIKSKNSGCKIVLNLFQLVSLLY